MEIPIQVAVRVGRSTQTNDFICVKSNPYANQVILANHQTYSVTYALPMECSQNHVFATTIQPLIHTLLEGCDISIVTIGQVSTGKTYTLLGPGFHCAFSESEHGMIPRCIREIFSRLAQHPERNYIVNIAWTQICGENIQDLLGTGSIQCFSVTDVFHWLQLGMNNRAPHHAHTLFTVTLEQQWIGTDGILQHHISTASFADLSSSDKLYALGNRGEPQAVPIDSGLLALDRVVNYLTDVCRAYQQCIPYNHSTLTTLLKDSFGGRAKTLVICCISPMLQDYSETLYTLQFAAKVQNIRNFVTTNSYSNIIADEYNIDNCTSEIGSVDQSTNADVFGLQFAASQWLKLVSNAEDLFNKLAGSNILSEQDKEQISEWLFLKQECEECLSSEETISIGVTEPRRSLGRIEEETETDNETSTPTAISESETESDIELHRPDFLEKLQDFIEDFLIQTDRLVHDHNDEYFKHDTFIEPVYFEELEKNREDPDTVSDACTSSPLAHLNGARGRRKSIRPGEDLLSDMDVPKTPEQLPEEIDEKDLVEKKIELQESLSHKQKSIVNISNPAKKIKVLSLNNETKQNRIRQVLEDLEGAKKQIDELQNTIQIKKELIQDMIKNEGTRANAKKKFQKKISKYEEEYNKVRAQLAQAESALSLCDQSEYREEVDKFKALASRYERRLKDTEYIKQISEESVKKVQELENSLHTSRKQLESLKKQLKEEEKQKQTLEQELLEDKQKIADLEQQTIILQAQEKQRTKEINAKISHLDQILKDKSEDTDIDEREMLRHEIRNLRKTRDCLVEQRYQLDHKLRKEKMLTDSERRKLLECEEAVVIIDMAIEYKNELICGKKEMDIERIEQEKGEKMLMQRLMKLSDDEMRTLLYKYFQKVIDYRDSTEKLEIQIIELENEKDANASREQKLRYALRHEYLRGERRVMQLQRLHEDRLNRMLQHFAEETSTSSSTERKGDKCIAKALERRHVEAGHELAMFEMPPARSKHIKFSQQQQGREERVVAKYREEGHERNRLLARFQELTGCSTQKRRIHDSSGILQQNLKQLQPSNSEPGNKVIRQSNKIIIQQQSKSKKYP